MGWPLGNLRLVPIHQSIFDRQQHLRRHRDLSSARRNELQRLCESKCRLIQKIVARALVQLHLKDLALRGHVHQHDRLPLPAAELGLPWVDRSWRAHQACFGLHALVSGRRWRVGRLPATRPATHDPQAGRAARFQGWARNVACRRGRFRRNHRQCDFGVDRHGTRVDRDR